MEITQERVRELFDYREGGVLVRRVRRGPGMPGDIVGSARKDGYLSVFIGGHHHLLHRVIFLWHHGWLPAQVDHRDLNRSNNRIDNLRPATQSNNGANRGAYASNKSGFKGVCWNRAVGKWQAQIRVNRKVKHLGYFNDPAEGGAVYAKAAAELHGEFARVA